VTKIDATSLIDLVESGKFVSQKKYCEQIIKKTLEKTFTDNKIDVVTLSSTHLPFLLSILQKIFPTITFLDPAGIVAQQVIGNKSFIPSKKNSLQIFTTGNPVLFQKNLLKLNIKNKVIKFQ
ncbi:MAG: glutamate racemase, partial [Candidatus Nitrosotenuis sp.]